MDRPVIFVTTEYGPSSAEKVLREKGLGVIEPGLLNFVDAYNETVGMSVSDRPDTIGANCGNLTSMGIAISKMQKRIAKEGILLVFDSLTSPYLLSGPAVVRFLRLNLSKFVAEGNSVLACFDEGSGKDEDLVGMMSLSNGVVKMELKEGKKVLDVVKHPEVNPTRIEVSVAKVGEKELWDSRFWDREMYRRLFKAEESGRVLSREFMELGVNGFWPNFAFWSGMLWDPKRFPTMRYELTKKYGSLVREVFPYLSYRTRVLIKLFMPKNVSKVKDFKKLLRVFKGYARSRGFGIVEYLDTVSKTDEHHFRIFESHDCWGFESVGTQMALLLPPLAAGQCKGFEMQKRDWNGVETKCIGLGDPYCEFKLVPGEIDELKDSMQKESSVVERIHDRLMHRLMVFLLEGKPLVERTRLGSDVYMEALSHAMGLPAMVSERYRMALRMGGVKAGKKIEEELKEAGLGEEEAIKRVFHFLEHCKVGKVTVNETIRIRENRESTWTKGWTSKWEEPCCFFTTGFFNGFFSAAKNQHVKETKCIAMGDPYCEWEFR